MHVWQGCQQFDSLTNTGKNNDDGKFVWSRGTEKRKRCFVRFVNIAGAFKSRSAKFVIAGTPATVEELLVTKSVPCVSGELHKHLFYNVSLGASQQ